MKTNRLKRILAAVSPLMFMAATAGHWAYAATALPGRSVEALPGSPEMSQSGATIIEAQWRIRPDVDVPGAATPRPALPPRPPVANTRPNLPPATRPPPRFGGNNGTPATAPPVRGNTPVRTVRPLPATPTAPTPRQPFTLPRPTPNEPIVRTVPGQDGGRIAIGRSGVPRSLAGAPIPTNPRTGTVLPPPTRGGQLPPGVRQGNAQANTRQLQDALNRGDQLLDASARAAASRQFMENAIASGAVRRQNGKFFDAEGFEVSIADRGTVRLVRTLGGERVGPALPPRPANLRPVQQLPAPTPNTAPLPFNITELSNRLVRDNVIRRDAGEFFDRAGNQVRLAPGTPNGFLPMQGGRRIAAWGPPPVRGQNNVFTLPPPPNRAANANPADDVFARSDARSVFNQRNGSAINEVACGPTSCAMVMSDRGQRIDIRTLSRDAGLLPNQGTSVANLALALQRNGVRDARYAPTASMRQLQDATANGSSAIVHLNNPGSNVGHFVVVDGVQNVAGRPFVAIRDPWGGTRMSVPADRFANRFSGHAVLTNGP